MTSSLIAALIGCAATSAYAQGFSASDLAKRTIESRAVEAVNWGMPAVNYDLMLQEMLSKTDGKVNQILYWSRPLDWHNQTLTPNPDAIYFMAFFNTKDAGPIVVEIPRLRTVTRSMPILSMFGRYLSKTPDCTGSTKARGLNS